MKKMTLDNAKLRKIFKEGLCTIAALWLFNELCAYNRATAQVAGELVSAVLAAPAEELYKAAFALTPIGWSGASMLGVMEFLAYIGEGQPVIARIPAFIMHLATGAMYYALVVNKKKLWLIFAAPLGIVMHGMFNYLSVMKPWVLIYQEFFLGIPVKKYLEFQNLWWVIAFVIAFAAIGVVSYYWVKKGGEKKVGE